jgi:hypothetical protein
MRRPVVSVVRFVSISTAAVILVVCVRVGVWAFPASTAVGFALLTFIVAFTVSMARLPQRSGGSETHAGPPSRASVVISTGVGAGANIAVFALLGLYEIAGPASWPIVWAALVIATTVLWLLWRRHRMPARIIDIVRTNPPVGRNTQAPAYPAIGGGTLTDLSTDQLCRAWRQSWLVLLDSGLDPTQRARMVETRRRYLDELERRDPTGFSRWLDSGARAGGDPLKFITSQLDPIDPRNGDDPPGYRQFAD